MLTKGSSRHKQCTAKQRQENCTDTRSTTKRHATKERRQNSELENSVDKIAGQTVRDKTTQPNQCTNITRTTKQCTNITRTTKQCIYITSYQQYSDKPAGSFLRPYETEIYLHYFHIWGPTFPESVRLAPDRHVAHMAHVVHVALVGRQENLFYRTALHSNV